MSAEVPATASTDVPSASQTVEMPVESAAAEQAAADVPDSSSALPDSPAASASTNQNSSQKASGEEESVAARVARMWTEHVDKNETLKDADRLTTSAAYRKWAPTAELGLPEGVAVPPFTEIWLVIETARAEKEKAEKEKAKEEKRNRWHEAPSGKGKGKGKRKGRRWKDENYRDSQDIDEGGQSHDSPQPPLSEVNTVSSRYRGDKAATTTPKESDDPLGVADPLADFAAEAHKIYRNDGSVADTAERVDSSKEISEANAEKADETPAAEPASDRGADHSHRNGRNVEKHERYSKAKCIEMFDEALRDICRKGLSHELPVAASIIDTRMQRLHKEWRIDSTPFRHYEDLVREAEQAGLIKVGKDKRSNQLTVTWIKYKYHVDDQRASARGRSRSRARGHRSDTRGKGHGKRDREHRSGHGERARRRPPVSGSTRKRHDRNAGGHGKGRGRKGEKKQPAQHRKRGREQAAEYSYSYEYTEEEYSLSPSPRRRSSRKAR